ncbi:MULTISPECIES: hypothetical protein [Vibrio]|uniref:hypothetical protein n=1 Tax=Vibrio TaxID=662 RepID=UPI001C05F8A3|nr:MULTISPECIES: hypothetical protein [Vibrio]MDK9779715.1 hypothetical protein [Vibrio sp. D401a]MDK9808122.1 hypothetical protein [Vibrio sp. D406a]
MQFFARYKQVIAGAILGFYAFAVVFSYASEQSTNIIKVLNSLSDLISSAGAIAALFTLIHLVSEKREEERNRHISSANYLLVQLLSQAWVTREYIKKVYQDYETGNAEKCINLIMPRYSVDHLHKLDLEKYAFLIGGYDPNFFAKLSNCKFNTSAITEYIDNRIDYYTTELVEPCKHIASSNGFKLEQVEEEIEPLVIGSLISSTDRILSQLQTTERDLMMLHSLLYSHMKKKYPKEMFIKPSVEH